MIRIANLVKNHGTQRILSDISLEVNRGEVTALIGPSGGGKSTLLRCINGLETFQSGEISVGDDLKLSGRDGKPHEKQMLLRLRRKVGLVFQQFNLFPHMTVLQNVMAGPVYALQQQKAEAETIAKQLLQRVGLAEKINAKPLQLSGGQQQRVAIARALAVKPVAILFDEPTSALDPRMADEVMGVMRDLATEGQTMIVVTHDMDFARRATKVHYMEAGRIARSGSPSEIL